MTALLWVLAVEYAVLVPVGIASLIRDARERAAWRRLALHAFLAEPIANLTPPKCTELRTPDWIEDRP